MQRKNMIRKVVIVISLFVIFIVPTTYATNFPNATTPISDVQTSAAKIWGTTATIVQILAFAAMIFAGLRYMFSSADQKADIKSSLAILVLGAILVFASATVVKFVVGAAEEII